MKNVMKRGSNVSLTREIPGLTGVVLGVRWDAGSERTLDENLVFASLLCDSSRQVRSTADFVFFNQLQSPELSTSQLEQALGGDQEQVEVDFALVPAEIERIVFVLYINDGAQRRRTLAQLRSCQLRVLNLVGNAELVAAEDFVPLLTNETALALGEVYRHDGGWKFKVLGQGYADGVQGIAADYGLPL